MRVLDYLKLALLNLRRQKFRTFLTVISVIIGAVAVLSLVTLGATAKTVFIEQLKSVGALTEINVMRQGEGGGPDGGPFGDNELEQIGGKEIKIDDALIEKIKKIDGVKSVYSALNVWEIQGIKINNKKYQARITGVSAQRKIALTVGSHFTDQNEHSVILGNAYLAGLKIKNSEDAIGKEIELISSPGYQGEGARIDPKMFNKEPGKPGEKPQESKTRTYLKAKIIGVTQPGPQEGENFIPLNWAKKINSRREYHYENDRMVENIWDQTTEKGYDQIVVNAKSTKYTKKITKTLKKEFNLSAFSAQDIIDQFFKGMTVLQVVLGLIGSIALLVAAIGIINTMVMSIYERTREIGVMRACGATKSAMRRLFTLEAISIGFLGGIIGVGLTFALSFVGNAIINNELKAQAFTAKNIITIPPWLALAIILFTSILGMLAGLGPAQRAARMDPVEALRYE